MIGHIVSHYKIVEKLGEGGMGAVYLAENTEVDRKVALEFLPAQFADDHAALERFRREAKAAASLSHPDLPLYKRRSKPARTREPGCRT